MTEKKILDDANNLCLPDHQILGINVMKIATVLEVVNRLNVIPIRILMSFFTEL